MLAGMDAQWCWFTREVTVLGTDKVVGERVESPFSGQKKSP